jgi:hypothetical protein
MTALPLRSAFRKASGAVPVAALLQRSCACGNASHGGGECEGCRKKGGELQRRAAAGDYGGRTNAPVPAAVHDVLRSPGQPLDRSTLAFMEPRFGHDFSRVRVHVDGGAAESARAVNAHAYAVGTHIAFAQSRFEPRTADGRRLLAHELAHVVQQGGDRYDTLAISDDAGAEREADRAADAVLAGPVSTVSAHPAAGALARQAADGDGSPRSARDVELDPSLFIKRMDAPAVRETAKCEEFPGGSTDCELDEKTGTPTGKVRHRVDETNPCTRPCVEEHEAVHVKQLKTFCPELRDCYLAADKGKRPASECAAMVIFGGKARECAAYKVSVPCMENRLKTAKVCQSAANKEYGGRKLASEKCFRDNACSEAGAK